MIIFKRFPVLLQKKNIFSIITVVFMSSGPNGGDHTLIKQYLNTVNKYCLAESSDLNQNSCTERDVTLPTLKDTCVGGDKHLLKENHGAAIVKAIRL